ncbi:hypothetical protein ATANTOWER_018955 [Ataeniobius toweri]|uniref:Meiosis-specific nuclear structural protein 1 n=1 Tax=Ataeniobius toweri TaxID=208326 RepID=A0ABU7A7D7_9TELE|nr:hypothetical protein [Ataeniobius toweri]
MDRNWILGRQQRAQSQEALRQEEVKRLVRDRQLRAGLKEEDTVERRRYVRHVQQQNMERQTEDALIKAKEQRANRQRQLEQEERMAKELARIEHEKQRDEKMRQHIRENSLELRELKSKLKAAYVSKERAAQIAEKEALRLQTIREEAELADRMKREHEQAAAEIQKLQQKSHEGLVQHQRGLEQQLMEKERRRQEAYEEFLKEKLMVDEIIRKIYEEEQMERQLKLEKVKATHQDMEEFKRQQAEWRSMEQKRTEAENRRIMEFVRQRQHMEEIRMNQMKEREEAKEHRHKMLCEKMEEERKQREEMDRVRQDLYLEKQEEANRQRDIEEMEKRIRQRLMMQQSLQEQLAFKEMQKQQEKEEEEAFRKTMMAKFAEDDRIEQMNDRKRRMKQLEHKHEVEKLMEDRRRLREAEKELEAKAKATEQEKEAQRRQIIEEERLKLLKLHATKLIGNIPKDLLRKDDLLHIDEDLRKL